ncbi:hypothetical protein [Bosea sp. 2RAB26]
MRSTLGRERVTQMVAWASGRPMSRYKWDVVIYVLEDTSIHP